MLAVQPVLGTGDEVIFRGFPTLHNVRFFPGLKNVCQTGWFSDVIPIIFYFPSFLTYPASRSNVIIEFLNPYVKCGETVSCGVQGGGKWYRKGINILV